MTSTTVMWFRRDLRVESHAALAAAVAEGRSVVALFVDDPSLSASAGAVRLQALRAALSALDASLGGALRVRRGDPVDVVPAVAAEVGATEVFVTRDHSPAGRRRDRGVAERLRNDGRSLRGIGSNYIVEPGTVTKDDGGAYSVFTPFFKRWLHHAVSGPSLAESVDVSAVDWREVPHDGLRADAPLDVELPTISSAAGWSRWEVFRDRGLARYDVDRDRPDLEGTSRVSVDMKWGTLHPGELLAEVVRLGSLEAGPFRVFASELAWREFYADVLFRRPDSAWRNLDTRLDAIEVDRDAGARKRFGRWCAGTTGFPIVDAGMRQLAATGWMHNRVRMITASFLVKDLHLPWQWGARWFLDHLIDGDVASNNHGWQWAAGTGTDAAPYFRVFNPTAQAQRFDPDGAYAARWIPELGSEHYPAPMVDHAAERVEALGRYARATGRT